MNEQMRIGAVSYLNTKPLVYGLAEQIGSGNLSFDLPSRLADQLRSDQLDVALIPSVEYFRNASQYQIVSDACIACRGPVWSVRLLSRVPIPEIRTLALDEGSRTSAALAQILIYEQFGIEPDLVSLPIDSSPDTADSDAILLIGDRAMHPSAGVYHEIWDLGDRWCRWSELPFVFAMWVARRGRKLDELACILESCRNGGLEHLEEIAEREAGSHGLTVSDCAAYFSRYLHFTLGKREHMGLDLFQTKAIERGLIAQPKTNSTI